MGIVFQFHHLFAHLSALENVSLAPVHVLRRSRAEAERRARDLLEMLGVGGRAAAKPHELSGGEAQRVAIARALAVEPSVLLMDEPTASLDRARRDDLAGTLTQLAREGRTVVVATHDGDFVRACADRAMLLEHGRIRPRAPRPMMLQDVRVRACILVAHGRASALRFRVRSDRWRSACVERRLSLRVE